MANKKQILSDLRKCALNYNENLRPYNLLIINRNTRTNEINWIETKFDSANFLHLTGCTVDKSNLSATIFYERLINNQLSVNDFELNADGYTPLKITALKDLTRSNLSAKMMGDYKGNRPLLTTNKLVGSVNSCMGFIKNNDVNFYSPNTVLFTNIKDNVVDTKQIILILRKEKSSLFPYSESVYKAKKFDFSKVIFPDELLCLISKDYWADIGQNNKQPIT